MNSDLMQAFNFTADDLAHNKQGRLSPRQINRLKVNNRVGAVVMLVLLFVSVVLTLVLFWPFIFSGLVLIDGLFRLLGGLVLGFLSLLFFANFFRFLFRTSNRVITKVVGDLRGVINRKERDHEGDKVTVYYVLIGEQEIPIWERQSRLFQDGHTYAIYIDKILGNISVEHLGGPTNN